jgi:hypothetical protein
LERRGGIVLETVKSGREMSEDAWPYDVSRAASLCGRRWRVAEGDDADWLLLLEVRASARAGEKLMRT